MANGRTSNVTIGPRTGGSVSHPNMANAKTGIRTSNPAGIRSGSRQPRKSSTC